jgi:hypothetical protein
MATPSAVGARYEMVIGQASNATLRLHSNPAAASLRQ